MALSWGFVSTAMPGTAGGNLPGSLVAVGTDLYYILSGKLYRYSIPTGTFTERAAPPGGGTLVAVGSGKLASVGGQTSPVMYLYDIAANAWDPGAYSVPRSAYSGNITSAGNKVYVGGMATDRSWWAFDVTTNQWERLADIPVGTSYPAWATAGGVIYAVAGQTAESGSAPGRRLQAYNIAANTWIDRAQVPSPYPNNSDVNQAATAGIDGRIYALTHNGTLLAYTPATNAWVTESASSFSGGSTGMRMVTDQTTGDFYVSGMKDASNNYRLWVGTEINEAPYAPNLTAPADGTALNRQSGNQFTWTFSDPNLRDSQSKFELRYRIVGDSAWTTITQTTPVRYWTAPSGEFAAGSYEWQVRVYDAGRGGQALASPWSTSGFFSVAEPPEGPAITDPANGATLTTSAYVVSWSVPDQDAYQIRRVADDGVGSPDLAVIHYDSGQVNNTGARSVEVAFPTNNQTEHIQVRALLDGLWSPWASVMVDVAYTPPPAPSYVLSADDATGSLHITVTNPDPGVGEPGVTHNELWIDDGNGWERKNAALSPNSGWRYMTPISGRDYAGNVRVVAVGDNGTSISAL